MRSWALDVGSARTDIDGWMCACSRLPRVCVLRAVAALSRPATLNEISSTTGVRRRSRIHIRRYSQQPRWRSISLRWHSNQTISQPAIQCFWLSCNNILGTKVWKFREMQVINFCTKCYTQRYNTLTYSLWKGFVELLFWATQKSDIPTS